MMRAFLLPLLILSPLAFVGCASQPTQEGAPIFRGASLGSSSVQGDFAHASGVDAFIHRMQRKHGFSPAQTAAILSRAQRRQSIINLMDRQAPRRSTGPNGAWTRYRAKFLTDASISNGVQFWRRHESALARASAYYGVPSEYIVAIIGVETRYGGFVGKTSILDALATLSFAYPRRADYFTNELEEFLVMARDEGIDPTRPEGSFAGAMGLCQFMPSSFRDYAVDFTGDGHRDLWHPEDAIGSVANYFKQHGWRAGQGVAVRANVAPGASVGLMKTGFDTRYGLGELAARGVVPAGSVSSVGEVSLLQLDAAGGYQYWVGLHNFYVITRYNHSSYYAMAVHQLAQAIRSRHSGLPRVRLSSVW